MEANAVKGKIKVILAALIMGFVLGVVARAWMRWISTDPDFSWSGSIFIVIAFMIFMVNQSLIRLLRQRFKSRRSVLLIRIGGVIFSLPIFAGAGAMMFPSVVLASVAAWNPALGKRIRGVLFLLALIIPAIISNDIVSDFGWTFATIGRILLFASIYSVITFATKPTLSPFRNEASELVKMSKNKKILLVVAILAIGGFFIIISIGIPGVQNQPNVLNLRIPIPRHRDIGDFLASSRKWDQRVGMIVAQRGWKIILAAVFGGLALGVIARLWMRWISTDPEFSWGGTLGIVISFTIFATTQATIYVLRRRIIARRLTSVIRGVGAFFTLPLFTAAGAVMFPTVILASIAVWRKKIDKKVRIALILISFAIPVIQIMEIGSDFGWNFITLGRSILFILIYAVVILLLKPTLTPFVGSDSKVVRTKSLRLMLIAIFIVLVVFFVLKVFVMSSD